jgi:triosephosphate isomerase
VGAQDVSDRDNGAFTGEISTTMLNELGCKYVVLGHSERRQYHGETNAYINKKIKKALAAGICPIYCIGETLEQRQGGELETVLKSQVVEGLEGLTPAEVAGLVIAYEPVWAIGTGKTATAEQAAEVCTFIRTTVRHLYGARIARSITIQYGGSMKGSNAAELLAQPDIDGGLIGGAALKPEQFVDIINAANQE